MKHAWIALVLIAGIAYGATWSQWDGTNITATVPRTPDLSGISNETEAQLNAVGWYRWKRAESVWDDGDGTVSVNQRHVFPLLALESNELARFIIGEDAIPIKPDVEEKHLAYDGSKYVEASQEVKDAIAAKEQAEQAAQIEAFLSTPLPDAPELGAYSNAVIRIENMIDWFRKQGLPLQRPIKPTRATLLISEWIQAQENAGNAELASRGQTYSMSLLSALLQFDEVGVTIDQVNAAYQYLKTTGRYPDRWEVEP